MYFIFAKTIRRGYLAGTNKRKQLRSRLVAFVCLCLLRVGSALARPSHQMTLQDVGAYFQRNHSLVIPLVTANTERAGERWISLKRRIASTPNGENRSSIPRLIRYLLQITQFMSPMLMIQSTEGLLSSFLIPLLLSGSTISCLD